MKEYIMHLWTEHTIWERSDYYVEANSAEEARKKFAEAYDEGTIEADNCDFMFETLEYVGNEELETEDGFIKAVGGKFKLMENEQ